MARSIRGSSNAMKASLDIFRRGFLFARKEARRMKRSTRTIITAVIVAIGVLFAIGLSPSWAAPLRTAYGTEPTTYPEAANTLLNAVTATGDGDAVDLGMTVSRFTCVVKAGGTIPTTLTVKLKGSIDGLTYYDLATHTTGTYTNKVANGTFTGAATSWSVTGGGSASWAYGTNNMSKGADGVYVVYQALADMTTAFVKGESYLLNYTTAFTVAGTITPSMCGATGTAVSTDAAQSQDITCTASTGDLTFTPGATAMRGTLDDVILVRNDEAFHVVEKPVRYIKGSFVSKTGGGAATTVTLKCMSGGNP